MENKKIIITIVILVLIILGLSGFIYYDKFYKTEEEKATITTIDNVDIDLNVMYQVGDILTKFDDTFNDNNSNYFGYIYQGQKLFAKNFDTSAALFTSMHKDLGGTTTVQYLTGGNVKKEFESIFGTYLKYNAASFQPGQLYNVVYDAGTDKYAYIAPTTKQLFSPKYHAINVSTSLTNDSIIVKRKIYYVEYNTINGDAATGAKLYTSKDKSKLIGSISLRNGIISEDEVMAKFSSSLKNYTYTFKVNSDGDYNFYSIEETRK